MIGGTRKRLAILVCAFAVGIALRALLLATSVGTNDALFETLWAQMTMKYGVGRTYQLNELANHPPLSMALTREYLRVAEATGAALPDVLRSAQIIADLIAAMALLAIGRRFGAGDRLAIYYLLTPAVIFISAFHCNTDPTLAAFVVVAVLLLLQGWIAAAGVALAVATSIKIVPILLLPLIAIALGRRAVRFLIAYAAAMAILFVPALVTSKGALIRNVFGYRGFVGEWGMPSLLSGLAHAGGGAWLYAAAQWYARIGHYVALIVVAGVPLLARRRRPLGPADAAAGVPILLVLLLFVAPNFGLQYLIWPLALLPLAVSRQVYIAVAGLVSAFLFYTYTLWSDGFPWWYANADTHYPGKPPYLLFALVVWAVLGVTGIVAARRFIRGDFAT